MATSGVSVRPTLTLGVTGDSVATRRIVDFPDPGFVALVRALRDCDAGFTNVEVVLATDKGSPSPGNNLGGDSRIAVDLRSLGINLASFAHNHSMNFGEQGLIGTLQVLEDAGIVTAGAGRDLAS